MSARLTVVPPPAAPVVPDHLVIAWADASSMFAAALRRNVIDRKFARDALTYLKAAHAVMDELEPILEEVLAGARAPVAR